MRSDMKRHMQMHARDGSDVSLLLACAEQGIDPLDAITADPEALAALREKTGNSTASEGKAPSTRARRNKVQEQNLIQIHRLSILNYIFILLLKRLKAKKLLQ